MKRPVFTILALWLTACEPAQPVLTPQGLGELRIGMDWLGAGGCRQITRPDDSGPDVLYMVVEGRLVRIDAVRAATIKTAAGVGIGSSIAEVEKAYGERLAKQPHKYVPGEFTLLVQDGDHGLAFETTAGTVSRFRAGQWDQVQWVEGCG